jgi:hypothetical protein
MNLGSKFTDSVHGSNPMQEKSGTHYPSFTLRDLKMVDFLKEHPCELGDVLKGWVKLKVTGMQAGQYGKSIDFDVVDFEPHGSAAQERIRGALEKIAK